jgi:hypothetical protein
MNENHGERLIVSFESIAEALKGICDELKRAGTKFWPDPKPQRESVVSRVPTDEDRAKESLGQDAKPIETWIKWIDEPEEDDGAIGERSKQWIKDHPPEKAKEPDAGAKTSRKPRKSGTRAAKGKA